MSFTTAGVRIWDATEAASIHGASAAMGDSLNARIVSTFATVVARNAAFVSLTSAEKTGILCWIVDRQGHSYWDPMKNVWKWVGINNVLYLGTRATAADTTASSTSEALSVILMPTVTLPPGNRLIEVHASSVLDNLSSSVASAPRAYVSMVGFADGDNWLQVSIPANGSACTVSRSWLKVISGGVVDVDMRLLNAVSGGAAVRARNSFVTVIDRGPCDD